jgi:hypothetical protein
MGVKADLFIHPQGTLRAGSRGVRWIELSLADHSPFRPSRIPA